MGKKIEVVSGDRFGRLTIIKEIEKERNCRKFLCLCDCGNFKEAFLVDMIHSHTLSCGCLRKDIASKKSFKHGQRHTRLYRTWFSIKQRCFNKSTRGYSYYGSRGITMCNEWLDFLKFYKWANENGYTENLTIERIDYNKNYEPSNCKWITQAEQTKNSRHNRFLLIDGEKLCLTDAAKKLHVSRKYMYRHIDKFQQV